TDGRNDEPEYCFVGNCAQMHADALGLLTEFWSDPGITFLWNVISIGPRGPEGQEAGATFPFPWFVNATVSLECEDKCKAKILCNGEAHIVSWWADDDAKNHESLHVANFREAFRDTF